MPSYRIQFDPEVPAFPRDIDADGYVMNEGWVTFTKDGKTVATYAERTVVSIIDTPLVPAP